MNVKANIIPPQRDLDIEQFLSQSGWGNATRNPIAGDASFRRYERIINTTGTAILMDAPPDKEDVKPFISVCEYLLKVKLRAPRILAQDTQNGFLLLEDLGDDLFSRRLAHAPDTQKATLELELYVAATNVLIELFHRARAGELATLQAYDHALLRREISLFSEWYLPAILGETKARAAAATYGAVWSEVLAIIPPLATVVTLRDYHADNLLVATNANDLDRIGLLDFQDAVIGSPAYDMVSFLEDARRDVSADTVRACKALYIQKTGLAADDFDTAYAILGAQRNCKIIGIFTRLGVRDGKTRYQHYLPRVWEHLHNDLKHPALAPLARWVQEHIPAKWQTGAPPLTDTP